MLIWIVFILSLNLQGLLASGHDGSESPLSIVVRNDRTGNYKRVCYFENWAWGRSGIGKMGPDDIDPSLCTHLIYGFATLNPTTLLLRIDDRSTDINLKFYEKVTNFKRQGLKVLIALGGWNDSKGNKYSRLVKNAGLRRKFIDNVLSFLKTHNFDGLDLDWEYPVCWQGCSAPTGPPSDKENFVLWVKELKEAFKPKGYLLSAAVSASKSTIDRAYDIPRISNYLDFINVMTYDLAGSWDSKTGLHSALYPKQAPHKHLNTDYSIRYWIQKGAPKEKLIMGMPLYGRSFTLSSSRNNGLNAPTSGPGQAGKFTREAGFLAYYEICHSIKHERWAVRQGDTPSAYKDKQWVSYDDPASIKRKSEYIKTKGLGGGMVWAIGLDDFKNRCGEGRYPLLNVIKNVLTNGQSNTNPPTPPNPKPTPEGTPPIPPNPTPPNPLPTPGGPGPVICHPTDVYASIPGMRKWCNVHCNYEPRDCPSSHCVCSESLGKFVEWKSYDTNATTSSQDNSGQTVFPNTGEDASQSPQDNSGQAALRAADPLVLLTILIIKLFV